MTVIPIPDQAARDRIQADLATNLLVEAGAGSGKTTALVGRMLQHVLAGTPVDQLAAVTFTRKAAEELRERFQLRLEDAVRAGDSAPEQHTRCETALRDMDRAFLGTIHSFCARLLRERPIEVGLDPEFTEIADADIEPMNRAFWRDWIDAGRRTGDPDVQALRACGVDDSDLYDGFALAMQFHDVTFSAPAVPMPDVHGCLRSLAALVDRAVTLMPATPLDGTPDDLMRLVERLRYQFSVSELDDPGTGCALLASIRKSHTKPVQKRWSADAEGKARVKVLEADFAALLADVITPLFVQWREYRYPIVMRVLTRAVHDFAIARHNHGTLGFDDLLRLTATLLREHPSVRNELGLRYRYLLVDEFQDTDPVQAEVCLLLASDASEGTDWQQVSPRPGALFVVGDPKQSIYRFRRADIQVYERVRERFVVFGDTLALTANFRSTTAIAALVNTHFTGVFPAIATAEQAAFNPMVPAREPVIGATAGVLRYVVSSASGANADIITQDAEQVAAWIASRIADGESPGSFLVLTARKEPITSYARALAERNIPVSTTGASLTQEHELQEVMVVLHALADPANPVRVVAALEGLCFGLSPADLFAAHSDDIAFSITQPPAQRDHPVSGALGVLHDWWRYSQLHPTDVLLDRIFNETGLLALAAGSVLGDARAGALLQLVESVRGSAAVGQCGVADAIVMLTTLLNGETDDAPLRPGRTDAVRVMNLHKAKGLEADIVILAAPINHTVHEPRAHVVRSLHGEATGGLLIATRVLGSWVAIAQPVGWNDMQQAEQQFQRAEDERLRYVAVTRARRALVVSQAELPGRTARPDASLWRSLAATVDTLATVPMSVALTPVEGRHTLAVSAASILGAGARASDQVRVAATQSLRMQTVTGSVKGDSAHDEPIARARVARGARWGSAVHRGLDAIARGRRGAGLDAYLRAVVREEGLSSNDAHDLATLLAQIVDSVAWQTATATGALHSELAVMQVEHDAGLTTVTEGVIDLAVQSADGWRVVDWKSDDVDDREWATRLSGYAAQVSRYASMLSTLTGDAASGTIERVRLSRPGAPVSGDV